MPRIRFVGLVDGEPGEGTTIGDTPAPGQLYGLRPGQVLHLGRARSCGVIVESNRVARAHAMVALMPDAEDRLVISDLGSTNGTWVDGERHEVAVLAPDREFVLGELFRFRFEDEPAPPEPHLAPTTTRAIVGVIALVLGALLSGYTSCSNDWFTDERGKAEIGLREYRVCFAGDVCKTRKLSAGFGDEDAAARARVFSTMAILVGFFTWLALGVAAWMLVAVARRRRPSGPWFLVSAAALAMLGGFVLAGILPVHMEFVDVARVRFGAYVHWMGLVGLVAGAVLLRSRRAA